jgi:hypothetical protein
VKAAIANLLILLENYEFAMHRLDTAILVGDTDSPNALHEPLLESLRDDPRWDSFLIKNGQSPEQLKKIKFAYNAQ